MNELTIANYEEVLADHRRLVRELDVLLNGENAAEQASLCDIVAQLEAERRRASGMEGRTLSEEEREACEYAATEAYRRALVIADQFGQLDERAQEMLRKSQVLTALANGGAK